MNLPTIGDLKLWLEPLVCTWGYLLVFGGTILENSIILGLIAPGVWIAIIAGFYARTGCLNFETVIALTIAGALIGDHIDFLLGRMQSGWILKIPFAAAYLAKVQPLVQKHGGKIIFMGRFSAYLRSWVALSAGTLGLPYRRFLAYDIPSAMIWSVAWVTVGYVIGQNETYLTRFFRGTEIFFWVLVVGAVGFYLYRHRHDLRLALQILRTWGKRNRT